MAFNIFKRKQKEEAKPAGKVQGLGKKEPKVQKETVAPGKKAKSNISLPGVLLHPHVTEKASLLAEKGNYVFCVYPQASKGAVKQAVEALYKVGVAHVRFAKKPSRKVRLGRKMGIKPGLKKAVVQVKKGESMEVISR
jgi:large subunit ribosomal protein L23